ncbi:MAG TPA: FUSC family protein [Caulobacteraceae bacterium]|nr:FUSC family protein [Caulobacteraceae bacterium]
MIALGSATRFSLRIAASALIAFALVQVVNVPLHGLWAVLTAVVVTQASTGGSIRATLEYLLGTLLGAFYATLVSLAIPHASVPTMGVALAIAVIPLAYAAARSAMFRVAPFTAVIVLLLGNEFGQTPIAAATTRFLEVALGGGIAVIVSLFVFPETAQSRGRRVAAAALDQLAAALPVVLEGLSHPVDPAHVLEVQHRLGAAIAAFDAAVAEARHERAVSLGDRIDAEPLSRTMLRVRHDLVIIGRAAAEPLPRQVADRVGPLASAFGAEVGRYLVDCGQALRTRRAPPVFAESALDAFAAEVAAMREEGLTRTLSTNELEQLFALGFAFQELRQNLADLQRCVRDWAVG